MKFSKILENIPFQIALDLEVEATRAYVKSYYTEEINGMADGSGLSRGEARRLQMFPELLKVNRSVFECFEWFKRVFWGGFWYESGFFVVEN